MKYYAKIISLNDDIEEKVILSLGEKEICCFINSAPYALIEKNIYLVELSLSFLDEELISEVDCKIMSFTRIDESFSYEIIGFLSGNQLITDGVIFQDDIFQEEFLFLDSKYVILKPDRISVSFL
jgi:hypothetical protein